MPSISSPSSRSSGTTTTTRGRAARSARRKRISNFPIFASTGDAESATSRCSASRERRLNERCGARKGGGGEGLNGPRAIPLHLIASARPASAIISARFTFYTLYVLRCVEGRLQPRPALPLASQPKGLFAPTECRRSRYTGLQPTDAIYHSFRLDPAASPLFVALARFSSARSVTSSSTGPLCIYEYTYIHTSIYLARMPKLHLSSVKARQPIQLQLRCLSPSSRQTRLALSAHFFRLARTRNKSTRTYTYEYQYSHGILVNITIITIRNFIDNTRRRP